MKLQARDKRALLLLGSAGAVWFLMWVLLPQRRDSVAAASALPVPQAEQRLARLRQLAAGVPGREELLKQVTAELAGRDKGVIQAETAAQALAQLLEVVRRAGKAQNPPLDIKGAELGQVARLGDQYGEIQIAVTLESRIEELLNLLAELTRQPEIVATREMRIVTANPKEKTLSVRLTVAAVVPRGLVPERRGAF